MKRFEYTNTKDVRWREENEEFGRFSNTFFRLARKSYNISGKFVGKYDVYDFHTVDHGVHKTYWIDGYEDVQFNMNGEKVDFGYIKRREHTEKEYGNERYNKLKENGYFLIGFFEQDVCGRERRIK